MYYTLVMLLLLHNFHVSKSDLFLAPAPNSQQVSNIRKLQICAEDDGIQDIQPGILAMAGHGRSKKVKNPKAQGIPADPMGPW